jgi:hypothetical protein
MCRTHADRLASPLLAAGQRAHEAHPPRSHENTATDGHPTQGIRHEPTARFGSHPKHAMRSSLSPTGAAALS